MRFCMGIETFVNSISCTMCECECECECIEQARGFMMFMCDVIRFMWQHKRVFCIPIVWTANSISKILFRKLFCLRMKCTQYFSHSNAIWIHRIYLRMRVDGNFPKSIKEIAMNIACTIHSFPNFLLLFLSCELFHLLQGHAIGR